MKKVTLLLLAALLVAPAMAVVEIEAIDNLDGTVTIGYECTEGELPRGIALAIARTDGDAEAVSADVDADYNTFIDWAYSNPTGYEVNHPDQHPFADPLGPGVATLPAADFSLCMGVLDQSEGQAAGPGTLANLVTITFAGTGVSTFTIDEDALRGGVVGSQLTTNLPITVDVTIGGTPECMMDTHPDYAQWELVGKPDCWCFVYNCKGDADGLKEYGVLPVYEADLAVFVASFGQMEPLPTDINGTGIDGVCADFGRDLEYGVLRVYESDLAIFVANFGQMLDASAECDDTHMNFWIVP